MKGGLEKIINQDSCKNIEEKLSIIDKKDEKEKKEIEDINERNNRSR